MDYKELAAQLRCPNGEQGGEAADNMFRTNGNMIRETIDVLKIRPAQTILEVGFGNAMHVPYLLELATGLRYYGIDISPLMVQHAIKNNEAATADGRTHFIQVTGDGRLDFEDGYFNQALTVNTLYFWQDAGWQLRELHRTLKPNGSVAIAFIEKNFADTLPFTQYGFTLYQSDDVVKMLEDAGFAEITSWQYAETVISNTGKEMERPFVIVTGTRK